MNKSGIKVTIFAITLNTVLPGFGYLYIRERMPLAIFLCISTSYEWLYNIGLLLSSAPLTPYSLHLSPFLSIPGLIVVIGMAVDVYILVKKQVSKSKMNHPRVREAKAA